MKNLIFTGVAATALLISAPAFAASDSFTPVAQKSDNAKFGGVYDGKGKGLIGRMGGGHRPVPHVGGGHHPRPIMGGHHPRPNIGGHHGGGHHPRWGHNVNGRWHGGMNAPGGFRSYRRPFTGFILPSYWINPSFSIGNFGQYGLSAPGNGYYWSRYYDDAVLRDGRGYVQDYRSGIDWNRYEAGPAYYAPAPQYAPAPAYQQPVYGPAIRPDNNAYGMQDNRQISYSDGDGGDEYEDDYQDGPVAQSAGAPYPAPAAYAAPQPRYAAPAPSYPAPQAYNVPYGYERYERCLKDRGLTGGAIGAVIGAVAGNRIAGRGDRLAGSLIGGGLGGLAGIGIEKATNKCKKYMPRDEYAYAPRPVYQPQETVPYPHYPQASYPVQQQGVYYPPVYYPQQQAPATTTVTVTPGTTTTTTTVTEEIYYETVSVAPRRPTYHKPKPKWRPKPKPRCHCH